MGLKVKKNIEQVKYPAMAEYKYDGELVVWNGHELSNDYGTLKAVNLPLPETTLMGEMFAFDGKQFYAKRDQLIFFDLPELLGYENYAIRRFKLSQTGVPMAEGKVVHSRTELTAYYDEVIGQGYEGLVVKPLDSLTIKDWVKLKRRQACFLYITGIRKSKFSVAVGTKDHLYGCCSLHGWEIELEDRIRKVEVIGEDKDYWFIEPTLIVEVEYQELIPKNRKLRNPILKRIIEHKVEVREI